MILAGDMGGTKSHVAVFAVEKKHPQLLIEETYKSEEYSGLEEVLHKFLGDHARQIRDQPITAACLGVAGPVVGERSKTPNLPWTISAQAIRETVGCQKVELINDLEANGYGIPLLEDDELETLQEGSLQLEEGHGALISAGTGLGEALLYREGEGFKPVASEGGHADFAPRNELEIELLRYLLERFQHVSYERVLSGLGLSNIYSFLRDSGRGEEPSWLREQLEQEDPGVAISRAALSGEPELCVQALDLFVSIYGAEAGNLALKAKAVGGLYVGGGIAPKIIGKLREEPFLEAFRDKGRLSSLMKAIPVRVILKPDTALYGAAHRAILMISSS
jgi:glucokinase